MERRRPVGMEKGKRLKQKECGLRRKGRRTEGGAAHGSIEGRESGERQDLGRGHGICWRRRLYLRMSI